MPAIDKNGIDGQSGTFGGVGSDDLVKEYHDDGIR